jgi:tRNA(adenine34) deaminase
MTEKQTFSTRDKDFMALAIMEAESALAADDYPVGAVLTVNGELVGKARNSILTDSQTTAHAEHKLLQSNSKLLRSIFRDHSDYDFCLYTTLEPCLMCLGTAVLHRVSRIVVACPDPHGGTSRLTPESLGIFYRDHWPKIEMGLMKRPSAELIISFLKTERFISWQAMLVEFSRMVESW